MLTACQEDAVQAFGTTDNLFLTGNAGTGKSYLVDSYLKRMPGVSLLASTGTAALLVGGRTFHSFFELGRLDLPDHVHISKSSRSPRVQKRLEETELLVIDEVSMLPGRALNVAEQVCQSVLEPDEPWGGLRVVCVGDFSQLPPVTRQGAVDWAFLSTTWREAAFRPVVLQTPVRSKDADFVNTIQDARFGRVTPRLRSMLDGMLKRKPLRGATRIMGRRNDVEDYNMKQLALLQTSRHEFRTVYEGQDHAIETLGRAIPVPDVLCIKRDALVMVRKNAPDLSYCNGSLGYVRSITPDHVSVELLDGLTVVFEKHEFELRDADDEVVATATNFPLTLAYATTIHKSQGATLSRVHAALAQLWEPGQAYVALSRGVSQNTVTLENWDARSIRAARAVLDYYELIGWAA